MSIRSIIEGIDEKKVSKKNEDESDYETISSGMTKDDAEKLSREKKDSVVVQDDEDKEKYSVIIKTDVGGSI